MVKWFVRRFQLSSATKEWKDGKLDTLQRWAASGEEYKTETLRNTYAIYYRTTNKTGEENDQ